MDSSPLDNCHKHHDELCQQVARKEARRLRARRQGDRSIWYGLGMFGLIGWSVVLPTLMGLALGIWVDRTWPSRFSWALMLLVFGAILGCWNAWRWVNQERSIIEQGECEDTDE